MELILGLDPEGNAETDALMRIAGYQYTWVTELPEFGYPPEVVGPLVRDAETKLLAYVVSHRGYDSLTDGFYSALQSQADALAAKLSEYKSKQNLNAAKAEFMDECGGGGTLITFKIPKEAKMFIIPPLYMKYCQNQGIDPSDRSACDRYREIFDGAHQMLSGLYYYVAEWPDGHTRKGQFDSSGMPEVFHLSR
jgi:hypothetical protein